MISVTGGRARFREKQRNYGSARELYQQILQDHPGAPQAEKARETLEKISSLPATPNKPLAFMTKAFPSAKQSPPLETVQSQPGEPSAEEDGSGERMLR